MLLEILTLLMVKHYIADYFLQSKFMFSDKHIYGGMGGQQHAALHGLFSVFCLIPFIGWQNASLLGFLDAFLHYHIDYIKSSAMANSSTPILPTQQRYWIMHGVDQFAHFLTYLLIIYIINW